MYCDVCMGHGNCPVCTPEPKMIKCQYCFGTGTFHENKNEGGEEYITEEEWAAQGSCPEYKYKCGWCEGTGEVIDKSEYDDYDEDYYHEINKHDGYD